MATDPAIVEDEAERLATWTRLSADAFGMAYTLSHASGKADAWRALATRAPPPGVSPRDALILAASREAKKKGFIDDLALKVARLEDDAGRSASDIGALLRTVGATGVMQAMIDPLKALTDAKVLYALAKTAESCACIARDGKVRGSGFLVGADLVLTAAHVVMRHAPGPDQVEAWGSDLWPGLTFSFRPASSDPLTRPVPVPAAVGEPVVVFALPHGTPPDRLDASLAGPKPAEQLDFALIRLAQQVTHVTPLNIRDPEPVEDNVGGLCFVLGFPGGTNMMFDADKLSRFDAQSGRVFYNVNTAPGMSGGCCVGAGGTVIAMHEGAVPAFGDDGAPRYDAQNRPVLENRAVALSMVRAAQRASGRDPLDARPRAPGVMLTDPALVGELLRAGLRLAGPKAKEWETTANAFGLAMTPEPGAAIPALHPWFKRAQYETWVDRALEQDRDRVCFVTGPRGAGKSFCGTILAAKLPDPMRDLVRLNPTQTGAWSWRDAITPFLGLTEVEGRMAAGAVRYDDVPAILARLELRGGAPRTRANPLFVAIDFGDSDGFRSADAAFSTFIQGLAAEEWARLVLIGLSSDERDGLTDLLAAHDVSPSEIEMTPIGEDDLTRFLVALEAGYGRTLKTSEARAQVKTVWSAATNLSSQQPDLQTAEAALCAIALAQDRG